MSAEIRRVLITGANKGIGLASVEAVLDHADDTYVLLGSRDPNRGAEALRSLIARRPELKSRVELLTIDVGSDKSVAEAAASTRDRFGATASLYGIVNNAGIGSGNPLPMVVNVNTYGPKRVCEAFLPLLCPESGRVVQVSSAAGPNFVAECRDDRRKVLTDPSHWEAIERLIDECKAIDETSGEFEAAGFGSGQAYGLSKACLNAYTILLAKAHPHLTINACTPGFIETDMTRGYAEQRGVSPKEMGMLEPMKGTRATMHLLFGDPGGSGWYFGSDAVRSPIDRYRSPGDPPYTGE